MSRIVDSMHMIGWMMSGAKRSVLGCVLQTVDRSQHQIAPALIGCAKRVVVVTANQAARGVVRTGPVRDTSESCCLAILRGSDVGYRDSMSVSASLLVQFQTGQHARLHYSSRVRCFLK